MAEGDSRKREFESHQQDEQNKRSKVDAKDQASRFSHVKLHTRVLIEETAVGAIIGKGGSIIKKLRADSGARIEVGDAPPGAPTRVVTIVGTVTNLPELLQNIATRISEPPRKPAPGAPRPESKNPGEPSITLLVENSIVGGLIGKGGQKISDTRKQSGSNIKVSGTVLDDSSEKTVTIRGPAAAIKRALEILIFQILEQPEKAPRLPYVPHAEYGRGPGYGPPPEFDYPPPRDYDPYGPPPAYGPPGRHPPPPPPRGPRGPGGPDRPPFDYDRRGPPPSGSGYKSTTLQTMVIPVPEVYMGAVIGKGGQTVNEIRNRSGCAIKIADVEQGATERKITITGSPEGNERAYEMIYERMTSEARLLAQKKEQPPPSRSGPPPSSYPPSSYPPSYGGPPSYAPPSYAPPHYGPPQSHPH